MTLLPDPYAPLSSPPSAGVDAAALQSAEVLLVHADGTIDVRLTSSRATRAAVPVVTGAVPPVGARIVLAHLAADPQSPVALSPTAFDTAPIGTVLTWSRKQLPRGYVLADGARHTRAAFPQGYDVARSEAALGNTEWTVRATDETFTVPDLSNRFIHGHGAKTFGARGGAERVKLTAAESGMPAHDHGGGNHAHSIDNSPYDGTGNTAAVGANPAAYGANSWTRASGNIIASASADAAQTHENMPPYVVLAFIVKVEGAVSDAGIIQGPPGAPSPYTATQLATLNAGVLEARGGPGASTTDPALPAGSAVHVRRNPADEVLEISWTPAVPCWWRVDGRMIAHETAGSWGRADVCIELLGATDARGGAYNRGATDLLQSTSGQGAATWDTARVTALFKLPAGAQATARIRLTVTASSWVYYRDATFQSLSSQVVGFW